MYWQSLWCSWCFYEHVCLFLYFLVYIHKKRISYQWKIIWTIFSWVSKVIRAYFVLAWPRSVIGLDDCTPLSLSLSLSFFRLAILITLVSVLPHLIDKRSEEMIGLVLSVLHIQHCCNNYYNSGLEFHFHRWQWHLGSLIPFHFSSVTG